MFFKKPYHILILSSVIAIFIFLNIYLIRILYSDLEKKPHLPKEYTSDGISKIINGVQNLNKMYHTPNKKCNEIIHELVNNLKPNDLESNFILANKSRYWPSGNKLYPANSSLVGSLRNVLLKSRVINTTLAPKGTQLKLLLNLEGGLTAIFKPRWYERDFVVDGPIYAGKDRDNAEVLAFYMAALLNLRSAPIAIGRKLKSKEIASTQSKSLKNTMFYDEQSRYCFYGKCRYCTIKEPICEDNNGNIDGVMILYLDLQKRGGMILRRSPWQRTYKKNAFARWETDENYCKSVREYLSLDQILDLIDMAIVDFLLQNGDRHHYESFEGRAILLDNGKGLGNPNIDHIDILAPFYQCCMIRHELWNRLLLFTGGALSKALEELIVYDPLQPVITKKHIRALDRRIYLIYSAYEFCNNHVTNNILK